MKNDNTRISGLHRRAFSGKINALSNNEITVVLTSMNMRLKLKKISYPNKIAILL